MDDPIRRVRIREAIRRGQLPKIVPTKFFAGPGSGASCMGCGEAIPRVIHEYEFEAEGRTVRLHLRCLAAWADEIDGTS